MPNFTISARDAANAVVNGDFASTMVTKKGKSAPEIWSYAIFATKKYSVLNGKRRKLTIGVIVRSKVKKTEVRLKKSFLKLPEISKYF